MCGYVAVLANGTSLRNNRRPVPKLSISPFALPSVRGFAGYLEHTFEKIGLLCLIDHVSLPMRCKYYKRDPFFPRKGCDNASMLYRGREAECFESDPLGLERGKVCKVLPIVPNLKKTFPRLLSSPGNVRGTDRNRRASDYPQEAQRDRQTQPTPCSGADLPVYAYTHCVFKTDISSSRQVKKEAASIIHYVR